MAILLGVKFDFCSTGEVMPATVNLFKNPWLGRSETLGILYNSCLGELLQQASKLPKLVRSLQITKPDNLGSIPGNHMVEVVL